MEAGNFVAELNQLAQRTRSSVQYEDMGSVGPDHIKTFSIRAIVNGKAYPEGVGRSKKEAKQKAAKNALTGLSEGQTEVTRDEKSSAASCQQEEESSQNVSGLCDKIKSINVTTNYIGLLNNYCQKSKRSHDFIQVKRSGPSDKPMFYYKVVIDRKEYPVGQGKSVKEAKQKAAQLAWSALQKDKLSSGSAVSDDSALSMPSTKTNTRESWDAKSGSEPTASSDSFIVFADSPSAAKDQSSSGSAVSDDSALSMPSTPMSTEESWDDKSGSESTASSDSFIVFADSPSAAKNQDAVKCKRKSQGPREAPLPPRFGEDFVSIRYLGSGGFSVVYRARHKRLDQFFAVKIALSDKDSLREVKALAELHHKHIIRYYNCWEEDGGYEWRERVGRYLPKGSVNNSKFLYIQMEVCTETLSDLIEKKNAETLTDFQRAEEFLPIFLQIVKGLEFIHLNKKIHRDLKPSNILRGQNDLMKIADFGLVTMNDDSERTRNRGTETYMAPEQKRGRNYDHKVDMFPLGLIFLEMIYKVSSGHERGKVLEDARNQKLPEKCSLFKEFKLIRKLLSLDPKDRPEASEVRAEVEGWIQREPRRNTTV